MTTYTQTRHVDQANNSRAKTHIKLFIPKPLRRAHLTGDKNSQRNPNTCTYSSRHQINTDIETKAQPTRTSKAIAWCEVFFPHFPRPFHIEVQQRPEGKYSDDPKIAKNKLRK